MDKQLTRKGLHTGGRHHIVFRIANSDRVSSDGQQLYSHRVPRAGTCGVYADESRIIPFGDKFHTTVCARAATILSAGSLTRVPILALDMVLHRPPHAKRARGKYDIMVNMVQFGYPTCDS
ncbi:hypothetical protein QTP88_028697 [Uroleucon formosanum]